jgi:Methyltransferase domain
MLNPDPADSCLEIGGPTLYMPGIVTRFQQYMVINMDVNYFTNHIVPYSGSYQLIFGDGCSLPFQDHSVDFVFGNAVLEHVPRAVRHNFAEEVKRISRKGYFFANDNHWFPLDPHYLVPFYQFLPHQFKRFVSRYVSFKWHSRGIYDPVDLLTVKEYKKLFPGAHYQGLRFPFSPIAESIVVWDKK